MANMSDYLEVSLRNHIFRTTPWAKPGGLWVGLFTVAPTDTAGSGTEVSGGNYARYSAGAPLDATWTAASATDGITTNAATFTFNVPSANWGTINAFAIFDAATAGNMLVHGAITPPKSVNNGDPAPQFLAGALQITFA
jgi:hypothetical protein